MDAVKVGTREFRNQLAEYLESETPVAVTRHGETIGFYIPVRRKPADAERAALRVAAEQLDRLVSSLGVSEDELVADFDAARRAKRATRKR